MLCKQTKKTTLSIKSVSKWYSKQNNLLLIDSRADAKTYSHQIITHLFHIFICLFFSRGFVWLKMWAGPTILQLTYLHDQSKAIWKKRKMLCFVQIIQTKAYKRREMPLLCLNQTNKSIQTHEAQDFYCKRIKNSQTPNVNRPCVILLLFYHRS